MHLDLSFQEMNDFSNVEWEHYQVTFQFQERFSLIVKRYNNGVCIALRSGS